MVTLATLYNDFKTLIKQNFYDKDETDDLLDEKQATLVSGTNIKTINNNSLLGSGNISISGSGIVDTSLDTSSTNPVQNQAIATEINSLNNSITNLADTTSWKYYINNSNYKVRYNDYRVNVDVTILGTNATTSLTSYGAEIIPNELRPRYPVSAFSHNTQVLLQIKDNDTKLYTRSMTGSNQSNINIYGHLEWDRR